MDEIGSNDCIIHASNSFTTYIELMCNRAAKLNVCLCKGCKCEVVHAGSNAGKTAAEALQ